MITGGDIPESLLDLIYEAATEPQLWESVLLRLAAALDSAGGIIFGQVIDDKAAGKAVIFEHNGGLSEESSRIYKERHLDNPWNAYMQHQPVGRVVSSEAAMDLSDLHRTDFFEEVLRPQTLDYNAMIALARRQDLVAAFNLNRGYRQGPYTEQELGYLARITPHMQRAMQLGFRIEGYKALQQAQYQVLDHLALGVVLLDRDETVLFANRAAHAWCGGDGPLCMLQRKLTHREPSASRRLHALVQSVAGGVPMAIAPLPTLHGEETLTVMACSIRGRDLDRFAGQNFRDAAVMLFITGPSELQIPRRWLIEAFGLTPAEATVALAVSASAGVNEAAQALRLSPNTVKTHLRRVFAKTATGGQVELARRLASLSVVTSGTGDD